ncbi:MAG: TetR/AcrR family transcriptional regulator [Verrucomicrobia bacterium]|nr:MAG: TetR/AcrR family transcriptional regulator [Verrucomicrobiota bacterium]
MRKTQSKASDTRQKILIVSEELIVEQGLEPMSIRDIIQRAEVNLAAVHYHFGSRHGLIDTAISERFSKMLDTQDVLLAAFESKNAKKNQSVNSAADAWFACFSWLDHLSEKEAFRVLRLFGRLLQTQEGELPDRAEMISQRWNHHLKRALLALLPEASGQTIAERCLWIRGGMAAVLLGYRPDSARQTTEIISSLRRLFIACVSGISLEDAPFTMDAEDPNQQHFSF